jgi:nucleoside-diphosphate-sugar epimerase
MVDVNVNSTLKLMTWAHDNNVKHFVFFSTGTIYGSSPKLRNEKDHPKPDSFYGASKYASEILLNQFSNLMKVHILRLYPVYGPNQINRYVSKMVYNIQNNLIIELENGIGLTSTPLFVDDLIFITKLLLENPDVFPTIMNISGNEISTTKQLAHAIGELLKIQPKFIDKEEAPKQFCGDNDLVKSFADPFNFTSLKEGLVNTLL